jgi:VanZ family protein
MLKKTVSWIALLSWMGVIYWLSDQPRVIPKMDPILSNIVSSLGHIVFYGILYLLSSNAIRGSFKVRSQFAALLSLFIVLLYGISDEFHQSFVPGRDSSVIDIGLDLIGGIIAAKLKL